jgi:GWxTD domain-containing protein
MKMIFIISTFILCCFSLYGQTEETQENEIASANHFNYELLNFASKDSGKTRVDEYVQVPYSKLQLVKSSNEFIGAYTISTSVFDSSKKKLIMEKIWNEKVTAHDFDQSTSEKSFNLSSRTFELTPGEYFFEISIENQDSRIILQGGKVFDVRNLSGKYSISDIMIISKKTYKDKMTSIIPNITNNVIIENGTFPIFYEIYSDSSENVNLKYSLTDSKERTVFQAIVPYSLKKGANQIFYTFIDSALSIGPYKLLIAVKSLKPLQGSGDSTLLFSDKPFYIEVPGLPPIVKNIDEAVDEMVYIASSDEINYIKDAKTKQEELKRYREFWKKKDPNPSTEENFVFQQYYERVAYANNHFSTYVEGWKTDRGMVYITLGPPNNIEQHPFDQDSKPYEVWQYYDLNTNLVFVDETGFGDYRLTTPLGSNMYRYRY